MQASELLISASELAARLADESVCVFDCRWALTDRALGRTQFDERHIPTARYMPLEPDLSDPAGLRGRHPLPTKERFTETLSANGVSNASSIVAYDDGSSIYACRFWWMVRWVGHADVRVLDGGLAQWDVAGLETTDQVISPTTGSFELRPSLTKGCDADDLLTDQYTLLDARTKDRFEGRNETLDHTAGHIPGALCMPFAENLNDDRTFRRGSERFDDLDTTKEVVCYCGSGVSATVNIMAMLLSDKSEPMLYPGSWSEWIENASRPIE